MASLACPHVRSRDEASGDRRGYLELGAAPCKFRGLRIEYWNRYEISSDVNRAIRAT